MSTKAPQQAPLPTLPVATHDAEASKAIMRTLRHFHFGNPEVRARLEMPCADCLPALLDPFRDSSHLRYEYPLFLHTLAEVAEPDLAPTQLAQPLSEYLRAAVAGFAPDDNSGRMVKDNLPWIERDLRRRLQGEEGPRPAKALIVSAADALLSHLHLDEDSSAKLRGELDKLLAAVADDGQLLGYERYPAIHLLIHSIRGVATPRHALFREQVEDQIRKLRILLEVERDKSDDAIQPARLQGAVGPAAGLLDTAALSSVMGHSSSGSMTMSVERKARIEQAMGTLKAFKDAPVLVRIIFKGQLVNDDWLQHIPGFEALSADQPCAEAMQVFDREAARLAQVFAASRIAQLEIDDIYDPAIHDPWFENFGWEAFSKDELLLVPAVVALESADHLAGDGLLAFSRLLNSGRPVQVFVRVQAHNNPGRALDEGAFKSYRTELGYLAIAHRKAFVSQTSAARSDHLVQGYLEALNATRTSLHLINTGLKSAGDDTDLNAWLVAGAALAGRVHPFFRINPDKGDSFADRMDFDGNPQPEQDWPLDPFRYQDEGGAIIETEVPFTFADYGLLISELREHYALVPPSCESDDLVPLGEFLAGDDGNERVPFVWSVDHTGTLKRAVVSRALVHACYDRRNFWRTLQEMSGVRNRHVELALMAARVEIQSAADAEIAELQVRHEGELQAARGEAAGEVMQRLTGVLMGMDFSAGSLPTVAVPSAAAAVTVVEHASPEPEVDATDAGEDELEPDEDLGSEEPWIDSPLCTSCNDCLVINPVVFVYNDDNQAYIADANAGTYAQMVEAAEICPAKCIHPGQPLDAGEAGLEELKLRAAAFN